MENGEFEPLEITPLSAPPDLPYAMKSQEANGQEQASWILCWEKCADEKGEKIPRLRLRSQHLWKILQPSVEVSLFKNTTLLYVFISLWYFDFDVQLLRLFYRLIPLIVDNIIVLSIDVHGTVRRLMSVLIWVDDVRRFPYSSSRIELIYFFTAKIPNDSVGNMFHTISYFAELCLN